VAPKPAALAPKREAVTPKRGAGGRHREAASVIDR
jgi:hypothetical protein